MHEGKTLKAFIKGKGYTQETFAAGLKVSRTYVIQMFDKEKLPDGYVEKINDFLKIDFRKAIGATSQSHAPAISVGAHNINLTDIERENQQLKQQVMELYQKVVSLQEIIIHMQAKDGKKKVEKIS